MVETAYIPKNLEEALRLRKETGARPIAGGTDMMVAYRRGTGLVARFPWPVMIISQMAVFKGIRMEDGDVSIGAGCTCHEIEVSEMVPWPVRMAASLMGAQSLRNLATVGGNVCNASPKADLPVPLLMLDARVELISVSGVRQISLDDFLVGPKKTALRDDELLMRLIIPAVQPAFTYLWYRKIGTRRANAISKLSLSAAITINAEGMITDFRSASGAAGPRIARSRQVENLLIGTSVEELESHLSVFLSAYDGILSPQAMPEYRRSSTRRMLEHFLLTVSTRPAQGIIE